MLEQALLEQVQLAFWLLYWAALVAGAFSGTVTYRVRNMNLGATLSPPSTAYIAEVEYVN